MPVIFLGQAAVYTTRSNGCFCMDAAAQAGPGDEQKYSTSMIIKHTYESIYKIHAHASFSCCVDLIDID
jgi:hypothetical protein